MYGGTPDKQIHQGGYDGPDLVEGETYDVNDPLVRARLAGLDEHLCRVSMRRRGGYGLLPTDRSSGIRGVPRWTTGVGVPRMSLKGIRVLELAAVGTTVGRASTASGIAIAWVTKLFADLGADVIRVESADGDDRVRARPDELHRWLTTNKRSIRHQPGGSVEDLLSGANLVVHDGSWPELAPELATEQWPHLVVLAVTPFGQSGPYRDYAAEELSVIHGSSWGFLSPSAATNIELPPLKAAGHHATINVATAAAAAAVAAVDHATRTGHGEHIDFSMYAAAAKLTEFAPAAASFLGVDASRLGTKTVVPWGIFECADGLVSIICPEQEQWESLVELMGNPEWASLDAVTTQPARRDNADVVAIYLGEWLATQSVDELAVQAQHARVCITPVTTMAQLDANDHLNARGFFAESPDGTRQLGPGYKLDQPWWELRSAAASLGQHDGETWYPRVHKVAAPSTAAISNQPRRPLDGVRVCDFTWIWAGPFATQYLAHLGAEVIKIESPDRPCLFRRFPFHPPGFEEHIDGSGSFQIYNSDKLSLGVNVREPCGREIIEQLVRTCDVVIDNFGVGTMADLGFGIDELRAINPDVIVASLSGYGQTGPSSWYMAYGPAGGSLAGLYAATGYEGGPAVETGISIGDPGTGMTAAWAIAAALAARTRTGIAATIDVSMVEAVASTVGEPWMTYLATGKNPERAGNHDPVWAPHQCYPSSGRDNWVTIACTTDDEWRRLAEVVDPALRDDARFSTAADRKRNEPELDEIISAWTKEKDQWDMTRSLQAIGIAAFPSQSPQGLWADDPQLDAIGMLSRPPHPVTGDLVVPGLPWLLHRGPNGVRLPAPRLGQHTDEILKDQLGLSDAQVTALSDVTYTSS